MKLGPQPNATNGGHLPPTRFSTKNCSYVDDYCPVEFTIYGYAPSLSANLVFCAIFGLCCLINLVQGIRYKTWTFWIALTVGALTEVIGYAGRIMMHFNAWSGTGFKTQICCLIIAPAFIAAGIYLMLKHIVMEFGPQYSVLRPQLYTWIFILGDLLSLILQGAGGGIAATADAGSSLSNTGNSMMLAGIVWQVMTLMVFGLLVGLYVSRVYKHRSSLPQSAYQLLATLRFKMFAGAIALAYITIFTRCVFRIAEMANGWRNSIMQDENTFIVLDGVMIAIATIALTICHPGYCFPEMRIHRIAHSENEEKLGDAII